MTWRYGLLFIATLAAALVAGKLARAPHTVVSATRPVAAPRQDLTIEIRAADVRVSPPSVPEGTKVALRAVNSKETPTRVTLAGYEDRVSSGPIPPGGVFEVSFLADRPGERFAWLIDGEPRGGLAVTGSHLVEGHQ